MVSEADFNPRILPELIDGEQGIREARYASHVPNEQVDVFPIGGFGHDWQVPHASHATFGAIDAEHDLISRAKVD